MKKRFSIFILIFTIFLSSNSYAYEQGTHFWSVYLMYRILGGNDEVSKYLALQSQWIDVSETTSAMFLSSQRALNHFQGDYVSVDSEAHGGISLWFRRRVALATRNHPLGSLLKWLGMKLGNLMLIGMGDHHEDDSYGHSGYDSGLGHFYDGHGTDDPAREPDKFKDRIRTKTRSVIRTIELMPEKWLDTASALKYLNTPDTQKILGRKVTAADLKNEDLMADLLSTRPDFVNLYRTLIYATEQYKMIALRDIYNGFIKNGAINPEITFDELIPADLMKDPKLETIDVLTSIIVTGINGEFLKTKSGKEIFNLPILFGGTSKQEVMNRLDQDTRSYATRMRLFNAKQLKLEELAKFASENPKDMGARNTYLNFKADVESDLAFFIQGLSESADVDAILKSEELLVKRAHELAQLKVAYDIAFNLVKDFIPQAKSEYYKTNFELNTANREFFKLAVDEIFRNYIYNNFGVNFIFSPDGQNKWKKTQEELRELARGYHEFNLELGKTPIEEWAMLSKNSDFLLDQATLAAMELGVEINSMRSDALVITQDFANKVGFGWYSLKRLFKVGIIGFPSLMKKMTDQAKQFARYYQSEPLDQFRQRIQSGEYQTLDKNKTANALVEKFRQQRINGMTCSELFSAM